MNMNNIPIDLSIFFPISDNIKLNWKKKERIAQVHLKLSDILKPVHKRFFGTRAIDTPSITHQRQYMNILLGRNVVNSVVFDYYFHDRILLVCSEHLKYTDQQMLFSLFQMIKVYPYKDGSLVIAW